MSKLTFGVHIRVPGSDRFSFEHSALLCGVSTSPFSLSLHLTPWLQAGFLINPPQVIQRIFVLAAGFLIDPPQDNQRTLILLDLLFSSSTGLTGLRAPTFISQNICSVNFYFCAGYSM